MAFLTAFKKISNIYKTCHENQQKFDDAIKCSDVRKQNGIWKGHLLWRRLCNPSIRTIAYIVNKQSGIYRKYLLLQGLCVPSVKTTTYVCNRFKMNIFFSNLNEKIWNKSTLNWVDFPGVRFYPLTSTRLQVWKPYLHLNSHTYLASCISYFFEQSLF